MKTYRNSARTRQWIRCAFTELIAEKKSINKITVAELAERADITKTTFYYHYEDIYAVAEEFENELIREFSAMLEKIRQDDPQDYSEYIRRVGAFIQENEESYRRAVKASDLTIFTAKLKLIFTSQLASMAVPLGFSSDPEKREVQVFFLVSACVDTVIQYLKGEIPASLEKVEEVIIDIIGKLKK